MTNRLLTYEQLRETLKPLSKPCVFLHVEAFEANIHSIKAMAGDKNIRVASKSIRSVPLLKKIIDASEQFQGVMCFTAEEALYLYEQGFDDLLVAYPSWDEIALRKISKLVKEGALITVMVDDPKHIHFLEAIAEVENGSFLVAIDIDLSSKLPGLHFGVYRSPLRLVDDVLNLVKIIQRSVNIKLDGIMGYEAQIAGVVDSAPQGRMKNKVVQFLKRYSLKEIKKKRSSVMKALKLEGVSLRFVNGGGTGSLLDTHYDPTLTEVTAGSGFYNSHLFDKYVHFELQPAMFFVTEITRMPERYMFTCAGGGYVASGSAGIDKLPEIYLPEGASLTKNEAVGEVQTPVYYEGPLVLDFGDPIIFRHSKAGELCERFHFIHLLKKNKIKTKVPTYRGEGKCFI